VESSPAETIGEEAALALRGVRLLIAIVMVVQAFVVKHILEDHLAGPDDDEHPPQLFAAERVSLSGLMTFFFPIFYLQWTINKYIVDRQPDSTSPASARPVPS
jgi:hypothetical protein